MGNKKIRKKVVRIIPALEFLIQLHRGTAVQYDSVDVDQAWKAVEEFVAQVKVATATELGSID